MSKHDDGCSGGCGGCIALGAAQERAVFEEFLADHGHHVLLSLWRRGYYRARGEAPRHDACCNLVETGGPCNCHVSAPKPDARELALKAALYWLRGGPRGQAAGTLSCGHVGPTGAPLCRRCTLAALAGKP